VFLKTPQGKVITVVEISGWSRASLQPQERPARVICREIFGPKDKALNELITEQKSQHLILEWLGKKDTYQLALETVTLLYERAIFSVHHDTVDMKKFVSTLYKIPAKREARVEACGALKALVHSGALNRRTFKDIRGLYDFIESDDRMRRRANRFDYCRKEVYQALRLMAERDLVTPETWQDIEELLIPRLTEDMYENKLGTDTIEKTVRAYFKILVMYLHSQEITRKNLKVWICLLGEFYCKRTLPALHEVLSKKIVTKGNVFIFAVLYYIAALHSQDFRNSNIKICELLGSEHLKTILSQEPYPQDMGEWVKELRSVSKFLSSFGQEIYSYALRAETEAKQEKLLELFRDKDASKFILDYEEDLERGNYTYLLTLAVEEIISEGKAEWKDVSKDPTRFREALVEAVFMSDLLDTLLEECKHHCILATKSLSQFEHSPITEHLELMMATIDKVKTELITRKATALIEQCSDLSLGELIEKVAADPSMRKEVYDRLRQFRTSVPPSIQSAIDGLPKELEEIVLGIRQVFPLD